MIWSTIICGSLGFILEIGPQPQRTMGIQVKVRTSWATILGQSFYLGTATESHTKPFRNISQHWTLIIIIIIVIIIIVIIIIIISSLLNYRYSLHMCVYIYIYASTKYFLIGWCVQKPDIIYRLLGGNNHFDPGKWGGYDVFLHHTCLKKNNLARRYLSVIIHQCHGIGLRRSTT